MISLEVIGKQYILVEMESKSAVLVNDVCNFFRTRGKSRRAESDTNPCEPFLSHSNTMKPGSV